VTLYVLKHHEHAKLFGGTPSSLSVRYAVAHALASVSWILYPEVRPSKRGMLDLSPTSGSRASSMSCTHARKGTVCQT
jgi:hypothetical protein